MGYPTREERTCGVEVALCNGRHRNYGTMGKQAIFYEKKRHFPGVLRFFYVIHSRVLFYALNKSGAKSFERKGGGREVSIMNSVKKNMVTWQTDFQKIKKLFQPLYLHCFLQAMRQTKKANRYKQIQ